MHKYKAEEKDGIDLGSNSTHIIARSRLLDIPTYFDNQTLADICAGTGTIQTVEELLGVDQPDLALVVAILVSTGWNLNDDVFVPSEVWKAKETPIHKPMNDQHDGSRILGHIVKSRVLDKSGNEIVLQDGDPIPDNFDIEVAGVLYKNVGEIKDRVQEIIQEANEGNLFVSMEAWFTDFAYAVCDKDNSTKVIDRTEATAFLTKHLRIYGGAGVYQGYKIGRVLKNIVFGGQGFVEVPANPDSVIKVAASFDERGGVTAVDEQLMVDLTKKLEDAVANLEVKAKEVSDLQQSLTVAGEQIAASAEQVKSLEAQIETLTATVNQLTADLAKETDRANSAESKLTDLAKDQKAKTRFEQLSAVKAIADADATLNELRDMSDEVFAIVMKYAGEAKSEVTETDDVKVLDTVEMESAAEFTATEDPGQDQVDLWVSTAMALCGKTKE